MSTVRHLLLLTAALATASPSNAMDAAQRRLALEQLRVVGGALYVAAHPDDENTAMLAWLANDRQVRTTYLALTRGSGGQNLIGTEQGALLGVLRTEELLAARGIDGAEQRFTRAIDFGYSKSSEETLRIWDRDAILSDVVWAIRSLRPDVVITRFPADGAGGHGHHTASAILAREAFEAAADPGRFPDQLRLVEPWQATRLVWNTWRPDQAPVDARLVSVDLGAFDPLLGRSYAEIAATARSMHKTQGFGASPRFGGLPNSLQHVAGQAARNDLFDDIDLTWGRIPGGAIVGRLIERALGAFDPADPGAIVPLLIETDAALATLPPDPRVTHARSRLLDLIADSAGLVLEASTEVEDVTPGETTVISLLAVNRAAIGLRLLRVELPFGAQTLEPAQTLELNKVFEGEATITVPKDASLSTPAWLAKAGTAGTYSVASREGIGLPRSPPPVVVTFVLEIAGHPVAYPVEVRYRATDRVKGAVSRPLSVVPAATVKLGAPVEVFGDDRIRSVTAVVTGHVADSRGTVRLHAPDGWSVRPEVQPFVLASKGDEVAVQFAIAPPPYAAAGQLIASLDGEEGRTLLRIDHAHIEPRTILAPAEARLVRLMLHRTVEKVGYIMGSGDEIPQILSQLGFDVTLLGENELLEGDLSQFGAIVLGIRAANTRTDLAHGRDRLMRYVADGGTLVMQYATTRGLVADQLWPYPLELSHDRVTDENAPVILLGPDQPLLQRPNRIVEADFDGWVQERGLYFPDSWDGRYTPLLEIGDPGETASQGALLVAHYGEGTYVYTGLSFFRQLPAGVSGAIRLFVNLLEGNRNGA